MGMALFTTPSAGGYSSRQMPQPKTGNGPWGDAIRYWLKKRDMIQADLWRVIQEQGHKTTTNTISNACLGRDCNTNTLRIIATALNVPLDEILVSPDRQSESERRRLMILEITEHVVRAVDTRGTPQAAPSIDQDVERLHQATEIEEREERAQRKRAGARRRRK